MQQGCRPAGRRGAGQVEFPQLAIDVAGIAEVDAAVGADGVDADRRRQPARARHRSRAGIDFADQRASRGVDDVQRGVAVAAGQVAVAHDDHRLAAAAVGLGDHRGAVGEAQVRVGRRHRAVDPARGDLPFGHRGQGGFVRRDGVGDVDCEQALAACAQAADGELGGHAADGDRADVEAAVHVIGMDVGVRRKVLQGRDQHRGHVGPEFRAALVGRCVERVQHAVVGADQQHRLRTVRQVEGA